MLPDGVVQTSGDKWDPAEPNIAFLAGTVEDARVSENKYTLVALNEINTKKQMDVVDQWCDERTVLIDSGIYAMASKHARNHEINIGEAFATAPEEMDGWSELYDKWCTLAVRFGSRTWGVIELDQGGREAATATREQLIRDTGVIPIPVYHPLSDGWAYYDELAESHDRICVGGLALPPAARTRLCWTAADRARAYPHLWTHLLGVSVMPWVLSLGMRGSVDSSAWLAPCRWATSWRSWAMLQRISTMPTAMTYDRGSDKDGPSGYTKAKKQAASSATFLQATMAAAPDDTHPSTIGVARS